VFAAEIEVLKMADFTHGGALKSYRDLMRQRPEWFRNNPLGGITILTSDADVERARNEAQQFRASRGMDTSDLRVGLLARDAYMTIVRDAVRFPDGSYGLYNRIIETSPVAILPILSGRPVMVEVFRHGLRDWSLEFPRGGCDAGESLEDSARREVKEEIGANVVRMSSLGEFTPGGSSLSIRAQLFAAEIDAIGDFDVSEGVRCVRELDVSEIEDKIVSGTIIDGFSIALFTRARLSRLI
jgi:ADP-ribose pyrophosphatase